MRDIVSFYKANPWVLVVAVVLGLVLSVSAATSASDSWIGDVIAVGVVGLAVGLFIAWRRSRDE